MDYHPIITQVKCLHHSVGQHANIEELPGVEPGFISPLGDMQGQPLAS
jgi:hypothetical protein